MRIPRQPAPLPATKGPTHKGRAGNVRGTRVQLKARTKPTEVAPEPSLAGNVRTRRPNSLKPIHAGNVDAFVATRGPAKGRPRPRVDEFHPKPGPAVLPGPINGGNTRGNRGTLGT